jgi:ribosome biogenesis protein Nip4
MFTNTCKLLVSLEIVPRIITEKIYIHFRETMVFLFTYVRVTVQL